MPLGAAYFVPQGQRGGRTPPETGVPTGPDSGTAGQSGPRGSLNPCGKARNSPRKGREGRETDY